MAEKAEVDIVVRTKNEASKELDAISAKLKGMSTELRIAGAAMTAVGVAGLKMVSDARKMNAELGQTAITLGVSTKEMRDLALATTDVTFPLKSVADTFELLARAGVRSKEEMQASAKAFDALADATGSSAEVMAEMLIPVFRAFGVELPKTAGEMDKFTWLTKNTTVNLSDFALVVQRLAPDMQAAGVSIDDAMIALATLESRGITGRKAVAELNDAIIRAAEGGISLNEALGLTAEEVANFENAMNGAVGITDKYAAVANEQFGIMDKIKQKWSELTLAAGSFLTPLEPVLSLMTSLGPVMIFFSTGMGQAAFKTGLHTIALISHKIALIASKIAIWAVTAAQWAWNVAMTANPIGLIILAIMALIAVIILIVKNWDTVREKTIEIWNAIVDFLRGIWDTIIGFFRDNWALILAILFPPIGLPILIAQNWGTIIDIVKNIWENVIKWFTGIPERLGKIFATVKDWILAPFRAALNGIEAGINWLIRQVNKIRFTIPKWVPGIGGQTWGINIPEVSLPKFHRGGVITEPTLLYGLQSRRPYAVAERGEVVTPGGAVGGITIHIAQLIVREEADVERIARELLRLAQLRTAYG